MIFIVYLSRYRLYEDLFHRIPFFFRPIENGPGFKKYSLIDEIKNGKHWKLEYVIDYCKKSNGSTEYLVRWKGYGFIENV